MMIGMLRKSDELTRLSLVLFVALSVVSIPIKFTGDFAYEEAADMDWMEDARATAHEQSADQATTGVFLLGITAAVGLYVGRKTAIPKWVVPVTLTLGVLTFGLMARSAFLGGQLRHTEIRTSAIILTPQKVAV